MKKRVMAMLSGGIDSTTMAFKLKEEGYEVFGVYVNAGQPHNLQDRRAINQISIQLGIPIQIIEVPKLVDSYKGFLQPEFEENHQMFCETSRPFIVTLSICGVYADVTGFNNLAVGYLQEELDDFKSRYSNLVDVHMLFSQMLSTGRKEKFEILTPLMNYSKTQIVKLAQELNVPTEITWSCWENENIHCGKCKGCLNRKSAFKNNRLTDSVEYKE